MQPPMLISAYYQLVPYFQNNYTLPSVMQDNNHVVQLCPNNTNPSHFAVSEHKISTQACEHPSTSVLSLDRDTKEACRQSFSELLGQGETNY